jgi:hypothetical protein
MKKALYVFAALLLLLAWRGWNAREISHPSGVLVTAAPRQQIVSAEETFQMAGYRLKKRAIFDLKSRVLSKESYWLGNESDLSPVDLALGWRSMSDQAVLDRIKITQGGRWYFTHYKFPQPITDREIISNSSNMHIIPANSWVQGKLKKLRRGSVVHLKGFLVDVNNDAGFNWRTSLRRDDTGNGSCEIFYVEEIFIL